MTKQTEDVSCGDLQKRCLEQEELIRDILLYLKHIAPYSYSNAPRAIDLLDRAAQLGIVPEVKP